jgi:hypothetical protein
MRYSQQPSTKVTRPRKRKGQATRRHSLHPQPREEDRGCGGGPVQEFTQDSTQGHSGSSFFEEEEDKKSSDKEKEINIAKTIGQGLTMSRRNCYEADWPICRPFYRGSRISSGRSMPKGSSILRKSSVARKSSMPKIILQDVSSVCPPGHWYVGEHCNPFRLS